MITAKTRERKRNKVGKIKREKGKREVQGLN